jgi:ADP-heptose:LPS heptosyltransferase
MIHSEQKRILVIGPHHIGDNLICMPVLYSLLRSKILESSVIITNCEVATLFSDLFSNLKVIGIPPFYSTDYRSFICGARWGFMSFLKNFDVVLDLRSDVTAGLIMLLSRSPEKWGGPFWLTRVASRNWSGFKTRINFAHEYYAYRIAEAFSYPEPNLINVLSDASSMIRKLYKYRSAKSSYSMVVLCPGASIISKRWPEKSWARLANCLVDQGFDVNFIFGLTDLKVMKSISRFGLAPSIKLYLTETLQEASQILSGSSVSVTCDSALCHLSFLVGIPVITIFGPSQPQVWFPYHLVNAGIALTPAQLSKCHPCQKRRCKNSIPCIEQISVNSVINCIYHFTANGTPANY